MLATSWHAWGGVLPVKSGISPALLGPACCISWLEPTHDELAIQTFSGQSGLAVRNLCLQIVAHGKAKGRAWLPIVTWCTRDHSSRSRRPCGTSCLHLQAWAVPPLTLLCDFVTLVAETGCSRKRGRGASSAAMASSEACTCGMQWHLVSHVETCTLACLPATLVFEAANWTVWLPWCQQCPAHLAAGGMGRGGQSGGEMPVCLYNNLSAVASLS